MSEARLLPVRMLNEFVYCPRLFHLEWVQREWADNVYTLEGKRVHKHVDKPRQRKRTTEEPPRVARSVDIGDDELGLIAKIDLLETDDDEVVPVDFKRGRIPDAELGAWEPERIQVAAQVLLLRRNGYRCERGFLWFVGSRRRVEVVVDAELEARVALLRDEALRVADDDTAPPPLIDSPKCSGCSLASICLPDEDALLRVGAEQGRLRSVRARAVDAFPVHVTEPGSVVRKQGDELIIERRARNMDDEAKADPIRVRLIEVSSLQLHGSVKVTTPALHALMGASVPISYLSHGGWLYGRTRGPSHKNVLLRVAQYRHATDPPLALTLAKRIVRAKVRNARTLLRRNAVDVEPALAELVTTRDAIARCTSLDSLLGLEGHAAAVYFRAYATALAEGRGGRAAGFEFERRNRRPPRDPVNAMLSFAYAMLATSWTETLDRVGFDPYLGFYHQPKYGRAALALDMMEEFRPLIADSVVLGVVRRGIVSSDDFIETKTSCALSQAGRRRFIKAYERRLDEKITHSLFGYRTTYRQVFEVQARLLGRYLTGEIQEFPELVTR